MTACPPFTPDAWSTPMLAFFLAAALYQTWWAGRGIRHRRLETYRDARLDPTGARAVSISLLALIIAWGTFAFTVWLHVCNGVAPW